MIKLPNWGLTLEKLNGLLNFTTEKMWAKNMKANFFNHPANIKTVKMPTDSMTRFIIDSHIDIPILKTSFNHLPLKVMQGSTSYHGVLNLSSKGEVQNLQINSDLLYRVYRLICRVLMVNRLKSNIPLIDRLSLLCMILT